jgi:hypothetical protein
MLFDLGVDNQPIGVHQVVLPALLDPITATGTGLDSHAEIVQRQGILIKTIRLILPAWGS